MVEHEVIETSLEQCKCSVLPLSLMPHKNQFHSPELFASKQLDDQSLNQVLAYYNDLAVHALPQNRTISRQWNLTVVHIVIALKQIVTATILNLAQLLLSSNRRLSIQLTVKNYALPERGHRRNLARGDGVEPSCTKRPITCYIAFALQSGLFHFHLTGCSFIVSTHLQALLLDLARRQHIIFLNQLSSNQGTFSINVSIESCYQKQSGGLPFSTSSNKSYFQLSKNYSDIILTFLASYQLEEHTQVHTSYTIVQSFRKNTYSHTSQLKL